MQDPSSPQPRKQGQKNPKPFSHTTKASTAPKQLALSENTQKKNTHTRTYRRRYKYNKQLPSNPNPSDQNTKSVNPKPLAEALNVPKQVDLSVEQPEAALISFGEVFYTSEQSRESKNAKKRYGTRKNRSTISISKTQSESDSSNLMDQMLVKPSRSELVNMMGPLSESLSTKSTEHPIERKMNGPQDCIMRTVSQNLKENMKEIQKEQKKAIEERRFFVLNEKLPIENETVDYKYYRLDTLLTRRSANITTLQNTVCSFLNRQGGRIYLGVHDDECQVKGMYLTRNDRDEIQSLRALWFKGISPFALDLITIRFVPIREENRFSKVPGLFVVKIVVKPGNPKTLYRTSANEFSFWIRCSCSNLLMKPDHFMKVHEEKLLEKAKDTLHAWDDPDLEADLIDMDKIYQLNIKTQERIEIKEIEEFIKEAGISCVIPPNIKGKTFVAYFVLDSFKEEVKKYFNRAYSVEEAGESQIGAPIKMKKLKL